MLWVGISTHGVMDSRVFLFRSGIRMRFTLIILLTFPNLFMTCAWYGHLKDYRTEPLLFVIALSWGITFFEYCLQAQANRLEIAYFSLPQLKVLLEVVTMWSCPESGKWSLMLCR